MELGVGSRVPRSRRRAMFAMAMVALTVCAVGRQAQFFDLIVKLISVPVFFFFFFGGKFGLLGFVLRGPDQPSVTRDPDSVGGCGV